MAYSVDIIAQQLFKTIKGFNHPIVLFTDDGQKTTDPSEARRFYAKDIQMMVNFVVDETTNEIVVNLSKATDINELRPMLSSIRNLANRYIIEYTVKTFGKSITPKDFAYQAKTIGEANVKSNEEINELDCWDGYKKQGTKKGTGKNKDKRVNNCVPESNEEINELDCWDGYKKQGTKKGTGKNKDKRVNNCVPESNEEINEGFSGWAGSARKSVNELGDARIIVKHKRSVDEEKRGARTRQIESIFIENGDGERFKFPSSNITAAKAMARHVKEGGAPFDDFGQHIYGIMEELNQLKTFHRKNKRNDFFEDAAISEEIGTHIGNLRSNLKTMAGQNGYNKQFESFSKESENVSQERIDELKSETTMSYFDESIAAALPYVARIIETMRKRQASESHIVEFARHVMNNTTGFTLSESCDDDDPEGPDACTYKNQVSEVVAWASYLSPKVQNEELSKTMAQLEENLAGVSDNHVNMAMKAINVIKQQATVAEATSDTKVDAATAEIDRINETFAKYDVQKIFGI